MELVLRGLMMIGMLDCPQDAGKDCRPAAVVVVPDTQGLERLGVSPHQTTLQVPLDGVTEWRTGDWDDAIILSGQGDRRSAAITLQRGDRLTISSSAKTGVTRPEPGNAAGSRPQPKLPTVRHNAENGPADASLVQSTVVLLDGELSTRGVFGANPDNPNGPLFYSPAWSDEVPRQLAAEAVMTFDSGHVRFEILNGAGHLRFRATWDVGALRRAGKNLAMDFTSQPTGPCMGTIDHLRLVSTTINPSAFGPTMVNLGEMGRITGQLGERGFTGEWPAYPDLLPFDLEAAGLLRDAEPCVPWNHRMCPAMDVLIEWCEYLISIENERKSSGSVQPNNCVKADSVESILTLQCGVAPVFEPCIKIPGPNN